ncbi:MAG: glycosyltransferase family 2 protein [Candidatus Melainabacteria bacterium]|nr:glycosyltransferase family 2 protein [Candidatus Melainabacteria bacterium]
MLVSICMPTYNGERYIADAIQSALNQTYADFELLISDDCSTDLTADIVREFMRRDDRIHYWRNDSRLGLFPNYNECMSQCKGELIKPFAQDDLLSPKTLEIMVSSYVANKVSLVCCGKNILNDSPSSFSEVVETVLPQGLVKGRTVIEECLKSYRNLVGEPVAVLFDAKKVGKGFSESYYSLGDLEFWFRILKKGDLYHVPDELVTFRQHPESTTFKKLEDMTWVLDFFRLGKEYEEHVHRLGMTEEEFFVGFLERAGELIDRLVTTNELKVKNLSGFKEVAFYSMRRAAQLAAKGRAYDALVNSTSWRITSPLRYIKTRIDNNAEFDRKI